MEAIRQSADVASQGSTDHPVIIIGAGQAGLAAGYWLQQHGIAFVILDAHNQIGSQWDNRWDSLRLFTPAAYSNLPGYPFPAPPNHLPTKDEVADYLREYASQFNLPVINGVRVDRLTYDSATYQLATTHGIYTARHVIVATGTFHTPKIPPFATQLSPHIQQLHSSAYHNPSQIQGESVLVVGAGSSGAQIAVDLTATHRVTLSGRDPGSMPRRILGKDVFWWLYTLGIMRYTRRMPLGQQMGGSVGRRRKDSRIDLPKQALIAAGVTWVDRVGGVADGLPQLESGAILPVDAVIWATGYKPDFRLIDGLNTDVSGYPVHERGVMPDQPGLYFMGLQFQWRADSHLINGVGNDAKHIAHTIAERESVIQKTQT